MFLKTLLLLALCFQAFPTGTSVRVFDRIHGGLEMGKALKVEVCDPDLLPEFTIRLFTYTLAREVSDVGLKVNVSAIRGDMVFSSMVNEKWGNFPKLVWKKPEDPHRISLEIVVEKEYFNVVIFDKQSYNWYYKQPAETLNYWEIEYRQEYQVASAIWHRKFVPCDKCACQVNIKNKFVASSVNP